MQILLYHTAHNPFRAKSQKEVGTEIHLEITLAEVTTCTKAKVLILTGPYCYRLSSPPMPEACFQSPTAHARKLHPSPPSSDAAEAAGSSPSHTTCLQHNDSLSLHTLHRTLKDQDMLPRGKGTNAMVPFHEGRKDDTWGMETGRHTRGRHSCNSFIKF